MSSVKNGLLLEITAEKTYQHVEIEEAVKVVKLNVLLVYGANQR